VTDIRTALAGIARHGLDGHAAIEVPEPEHHAALVTELQVHRLLGVAVTAVESGALTLSTAAVEQLRQAHDIVMAQTLRVELMLLRATEVLAAADIPYRVLKGAALAHGVADRSSEREYRDVDLLVPGEHLDDAVESIIAAGGARLGPQLRAGFDRRFGKSVTMRFAGVEIDLHRTLCPGPFGALMFPHDLFVMRDLVCPPLAERCSSRTWATATASRRWPRRRCGCCPLRTGRRLRLPSACRKARAPRTGHASCGRAGRDGADGAQPAMCGVSQSSPISTSRVPCGSSRTGGADAASSAHVVNTNHWPVDGR